MLSDWLSIEMCSKCGQSFNLNHTHNILPEDYTTCQDCLDRMQKATNGE